CGVSFMLTPQRTVALPASSTNTLLFRLPRCNSFNRSIGPNTHGVYNYYRREVTDGFVATRVLRSAFGKFGTNGKREHEDNRLIQKNDPHPLRRIYDVLFFVGNARQSAFFYRNAFVFDVVA